MIAILAGAAVVAIGFRLVRRERRIKTLENALRELRAERSADKAQETEKRGPTEEPAMESGDLTTMFKLPAGFSRIPREETAGKEFQSARRSAQETHTGVLERKAGGNTPPNGMNKPGRRFWYDEPDHAGLIGVRFSTRHSGHIGCIAPVYGSGASFGHKSSWLFAGFNAIGDELSLRMKDTLIEQIDAHVDKLEEVWADMVGPPTPDKWQKELQFSVLGAKDRLGGQAVNYYDFWIYDLNLGAVMKRYETAGWSDWYYWSSGAWIGDQIKSRAGGTDPLLASMKTKVQDAWAELVKNSHK